MSKPYPKTIIKNYKVKLERFFTYNTKIFEEDL